MRTSNHLVRRDERGAVLIIVAVFALVAIVMLAAVVDLGSMRQEKRNVTLSTDAAALAAANSAALDLLPAGNYSCAVVPTKTVGTFVADVARDYLSANGQDVPTNFPCEVEVTGSGTGFVVVGSSSDVDFRFGQVAGSTEGTVAGASIASIRAAIGGGLRPIGVCNVEASLNTKLDGSPYSMKNDVIDAPKSTDGKLVLPVDMVIEKEHQKKNVDVCGTDDASGQRGQLNFDDKNGNGGKCDKEPDGTGQTYAQDIGYGYHGLVNEYVQRDSGNDFNKGTKACLNDLVDGGDRFWLPVYDDYDKGLKSYRVTHFIEVEIEGYCLNNDMYQPTGSHDCKFPTSTKKNDDVDWFWFKVYRVYQPPSFPAGPPLTSDAQPRPAALCGEKDTQDARDDCK